MNRIFIAALYVAAAPSAFSQSIFTQTPEHQRVQEYGVTSEDAQPSAAISDEVFAAGPTPDWIWGADNNRRYTLSTTFDLRGKARGRLKASCDNVGRVRLNGRLVASSSEWQEAMDVDVSRWLKDGENRIEADVENAGGIAAFVLHLVALDERGETVHVVSDLSWVAMADNGGGPSETAHRGKLGDGPWKNVFADSSPSGRVPRGVFEVLPGFQVEKLFTVPKEELGSWVCLATDGQGRLLASDQGDRGICRITPAALSADAEAASAERAETRVEKLDFSACEFQPTAAQGMLWAFDSLYLSINGGPGSGLYRARDTNGDDQFDECVRLRAFRGGGEHGPHSLRLSPDGNRIFVICGNHTDTPFRRDEVRTNPNYSSRVQTNWGEDLLLPRMWDANGHARGKLAPGGWIASTDPDGETWELWSTGYRNPYDMAFHANGDLLAYDADMEWDVGLPWYRPTRVVHATSGSEFGWRSGSGKWPTYYFDSLPPLVNIGPGSPVGVEFGYGLRFPDRYQRALYICDWTFGTMYAIHLTPQGSSYHATREEFLSRSPLPLTDVAVGNDGVLYFTIGGRGTQSELYRVFHVGDAVHEPAALTACRDAEGAAAREQRRYFEQFHATSASPATALNMERLADALGSEDRALRFAAMRALGATIDRGELGYAPIGDSLRARLTSMAAIAKALSHQETADLRREGPAPQAFQSACFGGLLEGVDFGRLELDEQQDLLRTVSLLIIRLGDPDPVDARRLTEFLMPHFPSAHRSVSRELCQVLVRLNATGIIERTVEQLKQPADPEIPEGLEDLIARNRGYGRSIAAMLKNAPDQQQIWYAYCLRTATGWTLETRADFFRWAARAKNWSGGNSYRKFIQNIEDEVWAGTPENERVLLEAMEARVPFRMPELPRPAGPGKEWTLDEVRTLAGAGMKNRDFENGQKMFAAARCVLCHRFAGDGGATGPDLTQLAGRFNVKDLTEAILDPSKIISDQYKASTVVTTDGQTVAGRIISENDQQISVLTDPEDSTKIVDIPLEKIEELIPSTVSLMPNNLLKPLNQDEVLDLLAYLLSRGDKSDRMFRR